MLSVTSEMHALAAATMAEHSRGVDDEDSLSRRFAAGDAGAFDDVVAMHRARVTRLAYRLLGWRDDVEDVVQEVFLLLAREQRVEEARRNLTATDELYDGVRPPTVSVIDATYSSQELRPQERRRQF